ncbi:MAG: hypothetical protein BGO78_16835 [Chloroflexi bacterium 44-23]|nr:MAG: hypothetical protein BGO78_16835 [Chloroflexi bacterium 44-23]
MKTPIALLKEFAPEFEKNQMEEKSLLFDHPDYQAIPAKYKVLIGIAAAATAGSNTCTIMWVKMARYQGISKKEITEALMVARYMKQATVNDTANDAFSFLSTEPEST